MNRHNSKNDIGMPFIPGPDSQAPKAPTQPLTQTTLADHVPRVNSDVHAPGPIWPRPSPTQDRSTRKDLPGRGHPKHLGSPPKTQVCAHQVGPHRRKHRKRGYSCQRPSPAQLHCRRSPRMAHPRRHILQLCPLTNLPFTRLHGGLLHQPRRVSLPQPDA